MKKCIGKMLMLMAVAALLAGSVSDVAYAHSGHHSRQSRAAVCAVPCDHDDCCMSENGCVVSGRSGHHSERGHRYHH